MPINIQTETLVSFREAAQYCPKRRNGKRPAPSTFYRWSKCGLETIKVGGQTCTSAEAIQRFFDRLTDAAGTDGGQPAKKPVATPFLQRRHEAVEGELAKYGI